MKASLKIQDIIAAALLIIALLFQLISASNFSYRSDTESAARKLSRTLNASVDELDGYMQQALHYDKDKWIQLKGITSDFVIYRYCADTLQSWCNEFPVINDDLRARILIPFIYNPRNAPASPLAQISGHPSYVNLGEKWYVVKAIEEGDCCVIGGLEIMSEYQMRPWGGVNRRFHLSEQFAIRPLNCDGGSAVLIDGEPIFVVACESTLSTAPFDASSLWLSLSLILSAALLFLCAQKSLKRLIITISGISIVMLIFYLVGRSIRDRFTMFSPLLYAGGEMLYSLGAIVIINLWILMLSLSLYIARDALCERIKDHKVLIIAIISYFAISLGIIIYSFFSLRSIILNSGISLELYKIAELSPFCIIVYISFITLLISIPLLLQSIEPLISKVTGRNYNLLNIRSRIFYAFVIAAYIICYSSILGFQKEQNRMSLLSGRLAFDRDISLELYLKNIEHQIADDMIISALSVFNNTASSIQNHLADRYFTRRDRNYAFAVYIFNNGNKSLASMRQFRQLTQGGVPISDGSRFLYVKRANGQSYYIGTFLYLIEGSGISRVMIRIDSRDARDDKGYAGIFGFSSSGRTTIPPGYSYARYEGADLLNYRGGYAYPTKLSEALVGEIYNSTSGRMIFSGYRHFYHQVAPGEVIILSRPKIAIINYAVASILVALAAFLFLSLILIGRKRPKIFSHSYFRSRILVVLLASLVLTLVVVASVSVVFVYTRNDSNNQNVMLDRISSIASMIESNRSIYERPQGVDWRAARDFIEKISEDTRSDITLYTPQGKMAMSTTPMVFERHILGERISSEAYRSIMHEHRRACIIRDRAGIIKYFSMYASVLGSNGEILAIVCSPYNAQGLDFEEDAITHAATIIALFIVFLLLALFTVTHIVDKMFSPLSEMSQKMNKADLESLEFIDYKQDDEISSIVQAYNYMVQELMLSSRKLAQAERDKAWSEMARQVAHEIKNPLTPMKLQIQRVARLKSKGDPAWIERFDEASRLLLDHIDILTEIANEFSSFAKLYSEEPADIDLAAAIQSEISMFDNHSNIRFEYIGLENIIVRGPKPQLTRVFVNLLNNSVQAIGEAKDGLIRVSLRNSSKEGFYDIVFEDNGPGVSAENESKLFTPNFTTKNGGSGLGLAISRSVLENCGAKINYSRSFALGGASFCICYPKSA